KHRPRAPTRQTPGVWQRLHQWHDGLRSAPPIRRREDERLWARALRVWHPRVRQHTNDLDWPGAGRRAGGQRACHGVGALAAAARWPACTWAGTMRRRRGAHEDGSLSAAPVAQWRAAHEPPRLPATRADTLCLALAHLTSASRGHGGVCEQVDGTARTG